MRPDIFVRPDLDSNCLSLSHSYSIPERVFQKSRQRVKGSFSFSYIQPTIYSTETM